MDGSILVMRIGRILLKTTITDMIFGNAEYSGVFLEMEQQTIFSFHKIFRPRDNVFKILIKESYIV